MPEPGDVRKWLIPAVILIILLMVFGLGRFGADSHIVGAVYGPGSSPETAPPAAQRVKGPSGTGSASSGGAGSVTTTRGLMLPLKAGVGTGGSLAAFSGMRAVADHVKVLSVDADEGFWIGTGKNDRIWVQLVGPPPESPYHVRKGDEISFTAPVVAHSSRFAHTVGVNRSEGAALLTAQGQHLAVRKTKVKLYNPR